MRLTRLGALAQAADLGTYLVLGGEHELNPIVRNYPILAVSVKLFLIAMLWALPTLPAYRIVGVVAIVFGCIGAASNVWAWLG